jgi:hypothetical protein
MAENITYDKIIQYLSPSEKKNLVNFPNKPNLIVNYDEFPNSIKIYFNKNFFRYGVRSFNNDGENISFWYSVLCTIDKYFLTYDKDEQDRRIEYIKNYLINEITKSGTYQKFGYNYTGLTKSAILEKLKEKLSCISIQLFCDIFLLNIIILNFENGEKQLYFSGKKCNVYYPCLILSFYNEYYEPILYGKDKKYFTYNDKILEKLFVDIKTVQIGNLHKQIEFENNVINIVNEMLKIDEDSDDQEIKNETNKYQLMTESKLNKKRKNELLDIAKDLQLNMGDLQTKTKTQIITQIKVALNTT